MADGVQVIAQLGRSSEVECHPKSNISFFGVGEGWWTGFESIIQASQSYEVERNSKMNIAYLQYHCDLKTRNSDFQMSIDEVEIHKFSFQA